MAGKSILPFDNIAINGTDYGSSGIGANANVFVFGSGSVSADKAERSVTTNDGTINVDVVSIAIDAKSELYGDYTALNTDVADQDKIVIGSQTFYGTVTAEFSKDSNTTSIAVSGHISGTPEPLDSQVILDGSTGESS